MVNARDLADVREIAQKQRPFVTTPHIMHCWSLVEHWPCRELWLAQAIEERDRSLASERADQTRELAGRDAVITELQKQAATLRFRLERGRPTVARAAAAARELEDISKALLEL